MKRLMMVAAAMTIAGGAYAQCGVPDGGDVAPQMHAYVWNITMQGRTTGSRFLHDADPGDELCGVPVGAYDDNIIYRDRKSVSYRGYLALCSPNPCGTINSDAYLMLWDPRAKAYVFNDGKPYAGGAGDDAPGWYIDAFGNPITDATYIPGSIIQWGSPVVESADGSYSRMKFPNINNGLANGVGEVIALDSSGALGRNLTAPIGVPWNVFGRRNNRVEAFWSIYNTMMLPPGDAYTPPRGIAIYAAGQGSRDANCNSFRSLTGYFAGVTEAPYNLGRTAAECGYAGAFACGCCDWDTYDTAIYGKWAMKYNPVYSARMVEDYSYVYKRAPNYKNKNLRSNDFRYTDQ